MSGAGLDRTLRWSRDYTAPYQVRERRTTSYWSSSLSQSYNMIRNGHLLSCIVMLYNDDNSQRLYIIRGSQINACVLRKTRTTFNLQQDSEWLT